ncbi:MAG: translation elongation factor Ts [Candidatus Woykebacteria bacterium RBG_13_40_15]|uniref:Elongation factor Ts n=1 Tax=Candidatus Woykebacteria bacterium RBG_13_40_15 TaxID=1802593 RepID=A0A1G1W6B4_9BACT|nr:MAG: translation elongation factor Ts [Candidatus Woykebacteria bacterium RBG_13_40_15]
MVTAAEVKNLREETGAPVMEIRRALMETDGNVKEAKEILKQKGLEKVEKRAERETAQGIIESYIHSDARVGAMVHLACETDFVARTDEFKTLARELAMQVAAMDPQSVEELLDQEYIRDSEKKITDLVAEVIAKTGENIQVKRISRFSLSDQLK